MTNMNDATRDKFYGPGGDEWGDDGFEYELEPPDEEVVALAKRRAQEDMIASSLAIDVDEIYRGMDGRTDGSVGRDDGEFRFQFQIKHLLVLTAVLSVILALTQVKMFGMVAAVGALAVAGGALGYFELRQQRRWVEAQRRFEEKYERRRQFFEQRARVTSTSNSNKEEVTIYDDLSFGGSPGYAEWTADAQPKREPFHFQFSIRQMFFATTVAAVVFTLIRLVGGPQNAATMLGFIALGGLLIHAFGWDPPEVMVLGWWMVLVLYIVLSIGAAISSAVA
jgi:hypothetical protein